MLEFVIEGDPVPWAAHKGYGNKSYDSRYKERKSYKLQLLSQYKGEPIEEAVALLIRYFLPIPASTSKKAAAKILSEKKFHTKKPDLDNLNKFTIDTLKDIVILDDNQVVYISCDKNYSENPHTYIRVVSGTELTEMIRVLLGR